jgi:hypothetical protein
MVSVTNSRSDEIAAVEKIARTAIGMTVVSATGHGQRILSFIRRMAALSAPLMLWQKPGC